GFVVPYGSQVIQEAGQGEDAAAGDKVLPAMTIIGEVNVPDPASAVIEIEIVDEVGLPRPHVGAVEGLVEVSLGDKLDHLFTQGKDVPVGHECSLPRHVFQGKKDLLPPYLLLEIADPIHPAPEAELEPGPGGGMKVDQWNPAFGGQFHGPFEGGDLVSPAVQRHEGGMDGMDGHDPGKFRHQFVRIDMFEILVDDQLQT